MGNVITTMNPEAEKVIRDFWKVEFETARRDDTTPFSDNGDSFKIPAHSGMSVEFRTMPSAAVVTTPLIEGVTPASDEFTIEVSQGTLVQLGRYYKISDLFYYSVNKGVYAELIKNTTHNISDSREAYYAAQAAAGTNVLYGDGTVPDRASVASGDAKLTVKAIRRAVRIMSENNVQKCSDGTYHMIISPAQWDSLSSDPEWMQMRQQDKTVTLQEKGQLGTVLGCKLIMSNFTPRADEGGKTVYFAIVFGAHGFTRIGGEFGDTTLSIVEVGKPSAGDELGQRGSVGWKGMFGAKIVDPLSVLRVETV